MDRSRFSFGLARINSRLKRFGFFSLLPLFLGSALLVNPFPVSSAMAQETSSEQKLASISGIISNSLTGEPLAHAHVRMMRRNGNGDLYGAISGVDGRFVIKAVVPGSYFLTAEHRGFYGLFNDGPWMVQGERSQQVVTLNASEEVKDIRLPLVPDGVISGHLLDPDGVPIEGGVVEAINGAMRHSSMTDDRGEFRIGGLRASAYIVKAMADRGSMPPEIRTDGSVEINLGTTYYPSSSTPKAAAPVQVRAGKEANGIEIKLLPARILHVSGEVFFAGKASNVGVILAEDAMEHRFPIGPDHKFTLWRVPPGRYQVLAESVDDTNHVMRSAPIEINLTTANFEGIHLTLMPSFELAGRVRVPGNLADAFMNDSRPYVTLDPVGSLQHTEQIEQLDSEGRFRVTGVFPGRYRVQVKGLDEPFYVKSLQLNDADFEDGILDLRHPPAKPVLTVHIEANGAAISGTVRLHGEPASDFGVALFFDDEYGFNLVDRAAIGEHGWYGFHGLAPGKYKIFAYDPKNSDVAWTSESLVLYNSVTEKIEVNTGDKITLDLNLLP